MTLVLDVQEAQTRLSELLARVEQGEDVLIARAGRPVAHLPAMNAPPLRAFGILELTVPDSFFEPLPEIAVAAWE